MDTFETIRTLRSVRKFDPRVVSDEIITRILKAGRWSGSSKNTQPWQFIVVQDRAKLVELAKNGDYAEHLPHAAFAIVVITEKTRASNFDAGRCCQNLMLAAWNDGVSSCVVTMHRAADAKHALGIPEEYELQQVIAFGYPAADAIRPIPHKRGRKPLNEMLHHEKW